MWDDARLLFLIALPFLGSVVVALLPRDARDTAGAVTGAVALLASLIVASFYGDMAGAGVVRTTVAWLPSLGLDFTIRLDGFAWIMACLVTVIGFLVVVYARYYMSKRDPVPRFFSFLLAFMGAMLGVVLSGNLIQMVFFWELTSLFSFLLIGYWHQNQSAREGARMSLTVTGIGGLCLFAGVLVIGHIVGSYDLDQVLGAGEVIRSHELYRVALVLVLLGALTKSAQFPFHFWLPQAMAAPTPVSAYLHSATMVKVGVFLLARLWPVLGGTEPWFWIVGGAGVTTLLLGAYIAIFQQDIKGLLAYSTISHLGLITLLLGLGSPLGVVAAVFHLINHATFKCSLFMAAGIIDHESGSRDIRRLSGLFRFMPITATLAMVAAAAMAGVPLLNGFLSKEMFFAETITEHVDSLFDEALPFLATVASMFSVAYSLRFIIDVFFGPPPVGLPRTPHEPPHWMRFPVELLVLACLLVGIIPVLTIGPFLHIAVSSILGDQTPYYSLAVWHGLNFPLLMSLVAMIGGVLVYLLLRGYLTTGEEGPPLMRRLRAQRIFERILVAVSWKWARQLETLLGTRRLQPQLRLLICLALLAGIYPLYIEGFGPRRLSFRTLEWHGFDTAFALMWLVGIACAVMAAIQAKYHRLAALIMMGGAGLSTCITFVWLSAPDLALTQLLVEVVTMVLLLLGLRWMPKRIEAAGASARMHVRRTWDLVVVITAGLGIAMLSYAVMTRPLPDSIAAFFAERAYTEGGGTNVVNVILVDFRGFDTLGEITVLAIVALSVFALLRRFRPAPESIGMPEQQRLQAAYDTAHPDRKAGDTVAEYMMLPRLIMLWLFPVVGVFAVYILMRGHDMPGGGFAAGVAMSVSFVMQYMASGTRWVEDHLRILPVRWIGIGLLTALFTGLGAWLFGYPFLTSHFQYVTLPVIGKVPMASALLFDLGVYSLVVGATVLMLIALAHQSIRSPKISRKGAPPLAGTGGR
ncbi:MAG: monovalent cation/H+ antiporter subunit A [Pseudochelatococcus sp.]|jgi:multicomponent K+:H+ antiporter subunit A|uniref:monovalent cation/H+ antiporter subunit A n=1 Tax=Pseudochelatococcus sp. TaxID=2020869 RepID=UPI003D908746